MKILQLSFKNLNSLAGEWQIDFTHPDFVSSGIFAITGPTGAGKSTILDALCLALYGQTPRLNKITQTDNEIISRQTGECFAEVAFETARGSFRCHWSQHRSRKRADGALQAPKHEIVEANSGQIIESKLSAVAKKVEEVTGMDFDRFTRSMLLAQGGFAAFLQASPDKRAPILEQITGTAIYSRISIKVHECTTEQRKKLEALRLELGGMQLLAPEQEDALRRDLVEKQEQETQLLAALREIRDTQAWHERIALLQDEIARLDNDWRAFEGQKQAAAAELASLAQALRAMNLEGEYAQLVAVRKQQEDEQAELANAAEQLPHVRANLEAAVAALVQAELEMEKARDEQQREAENIRTARALDTTIAEVHSQLEGHQADYAAAMQQCDAYRASRVHYEEELQAQRDLLCGAEAFLNEHRADAALAGSLAGIEQQVKVLKQLVSRIRENHGQREQQVLLHTGMEKALRQEEDEWQRALQAVSAADQALAEIRAAREALLQGRELSSWRETAEVLSIRQNRLIGLGEVLGRIAEAGKSSIALQQKLGELEKKRRAFVAHEADLTRESEYREQLNCQLRDKLFLLNRVRDLEEERAHLVDGSPCPLCGALEHPFAVGNVPRPDVVHQELEMAAASLKEVSERLSGVRMDLAAVAKEIEQAHQQQLEYRERQVLDEALCAESFAELSLAADAVQRDEIIRMERERCQQELLICRDIVRKADGMEKELSTALSSLETARESLYQHDKARQAAEHGRQAALSTLERLARENQAMQDDLDLALGEVARVLSVFGYEKVTPDFADGIFAALQVRSKAYQQRFQEKERLEKSLAELDGKKGQMQALLAAAESNLSRLEQRCVDIRNQRDCLAEKRRDLFGERNPDSEERCLAAALSQAAAQREELLRKRDALQHESSALEQLIRKLSDSITARKERIVMFETALQRSLQGAGFAAESDFLQARLPRDRFEELSRFADSLRQNELELQTRRRDRLIALQEELDKKLSDKALEQIRAENTTATEQLHALQKAIGAIEDRLQQHAEQQQCQRDRVQALEMQKKECVRWELLHALIGSSDGKKFRNFAQGLTFELMVGNANRQLQKMSDRYILVRDEDEPLELNVIDNYQAGEIRSTRNLSGGESFIASLALSLGLSRMASRNVRVDSLFLDEGFGTLDEDALETALETLSGLQQEGKLIGIISHVPALKERIGTQIQVEIGSGGRSSLRGPGCQRIA